MPKRARHWPSEIFSVLNSSRAELEHQLGGGETERRLLHLYERAPDVMFNLREINSETEQSNIRRAAISRLERDHEVDPDAIRRVTFNYVQVYLDCHVAANLISEKELDRIMAHLCANYEMFPEESTDLE